MIAGIALLVTAVAYRLLPIFLGVTTTQPDWLPGFSPLAAIVLCGAACLPKRIAIALPFSALLLTDAVLNLHYGHPVMAWENAFTLGAFALIATFGWQLRVNPRLSTILPAALGSGVFFYLVTNSVSWATDVGYAKNFAGWTQALTTGLPSFTPTWTFFRNELISNAVFTLLFMGCVGRQAHHEIADADPAHIGARW